MCLRRLGLQKGQRAPLLHLLLALSLLASEGGLCPKLTAWEAVLQDGAGQGLGTGSFPEITPLFR